MNLRDLHYLLAVYEHTHFGKAAQACYVSQPALSMQLKKLEDELGVALFERTNKSVMPTEIGKAIAEQARSVLLGADNIKTLARTASDPFSGVLKLGAFPTLAPYIFPKIVMPVKRKYPKLSLLLVEEKTEVLLQQLIKGEIDAAMVALPVNQELLESHELFFDPFYVAVAKNHPLAKSKVVTKLQLKEESLLLLNEGHCLRDQALDLCETYKLEEYASFRATSLETLRQMVIGGIGITLMPKIALQKNANISYVPLKSTPPPGRSIGLVFRKSTPCKICLLALADLIRKEERS